jgi:hypothetical protein
LLQSDISAFGAAGMALELELLLRTGRVREVREWAAAEHEEALGPAYHWLQVQALAASGDYQSAQQECRLLAVPDPAPGRAPRDVMAGLVGRVVLDEQPGAGGAAWVFGRAVPRAEFYRRVAEVAADLQRQADATVLRGLIALEMGDVDEAEVALRLAVATWGGEDAVRAGRGVDFKARPVAQECLKWLATRDQAR